MRSPEFLRRAVGRGYRLLPASLRYGRGYRHHADRLHADGPATWAQVDAALGRTLRHLLHVPAFEAHRDLLQSPAPAWERLAGLPLVSKPAIKQSLERYTNHQQPAKQRLVMFTGGSTEHPMRFFLSRGQTRPRETAYIDHIENTLLGRRAGDWTLSLRGRTVATAATAGGRLWASEPIKRHWLFSSDHLDPHHLPAYVQALENLRPPLIHAFPSALYPLARWLIEHLSPAFTEGVRGIFLTSESIYDFQFDTFARCFPNAQIVSHYGHSERVLMATALAGGPYEFFPLYGYPELVDLQSGQPITQPGVVGELVGTSFDNDVMPFVRYRTGDLGVWAEAPQPGVGTPRFAMQRIDGRRQEFVVCADRRLVSITTLGAAHFSELEHVQAIQFEQHVPGEVILRVATSQPLTPWQQRRIEAAIWDKTQRGCKAVVDVVDRIERTARGKHRMLIQHLDLTPFFSASAAQRA